MPEEKKEPENITVNSGGMFTVTLPKYTTYRLKPHNIRTFTDLQDVLKAWDVHYIHCSGEDKAAKHPHLWEREE